MKARRLAAALATAVLAGLALGGCGARSESAPVPSSGSGAASTSAAVSSAGLTRVPLTVRAGLRGAPFDTPRTVLAPTGWSVSVWARLPKARLEAWAPDGRLLVSRPGFGDVVALTPASGAPTGTTLVSGLNQPHGLAFRGSTLYVAESDRVDAYRYAAGRATGKRLVLGGLPDAKSADLHGAYAHALKSVAVGPDGAVFVSVGSTANISEDDRHASPERATILRLAPGATKPTVYARGVRNGTGLALDPTGAIWTAVNDRDNAPYPYDADFTGDGAGDRGAVLQEYVNDHPLEELARLTPGRDLGWPYCNPDPDVRPGVRGSALAYMNRPFVRDLDTNADGSKLNCAALPRVEQGLPAHSAPLGLSFTSGAGLAAPWGAGALVGVHGSWNRHPPRAPEVSFFPWRNGALGAQRTLLGGFQSASGDRWGRPVAAVQGPDGAVYVSDDDAGAIYRMAPA